MKECWISIDWLRLPEPIWQSFKNDGRRIRVSIVMV